jgi:hypothetical protein
MEISKLKKGCFLKKNGSAIEEKVISVGHDYGYDFVELYNDVTDTTQKLIDISKFSLSDGSPYPQNNI